MVTNNERIKQELESLVRQGNAILMSHAAQQLVKDGKQEKQIQELAKQSGNLAAKYQKWYTQSLPVVQQLLPERYQEFQEYYRLEKRKSIDAATYTISDYLAGMTVKRLGEEVFSSASVFLSKVSAQIDILDSAFTRLDSILVNIKFAQQEQLPVS